MFKNHVFQIIPFEHAEHMMDALRANLYQPYIVNGAKHDFFPVNKPEYTKKLKSFTDYIVKWNLEGYKFTEQKSTANSTSRITEQCYSDCISESSSDDSTIVISIPPRHRDDAELKEGELHGTPSINYL